MSRPHASERTTAEVPTPTIPPDEGVLGRRLRALTLGNLTVVLLIAFEATAVGTAMPVAADELHGIPLYAFAFSAFFTASLLGMAVSGQWCDLRGPVSPLLLGILAFATGLVISGTATTMWAFVLGRAAQGIGGGLVIVALYVSVSRAYPDRLRPTVMASFSAAWVVPSIVGPLAAGTVTQHLGWRWVFLSIPLLVMLPLAVMMPAVRRLAAGPAPTPAGAPPRTLDRRRLGLAMALAAGAGLIQYAAQQLRPLSAPLALLGAALLIPAVLALLPPGTWRAARGLPTVVLMRGIASGSFICAESFVPLMLVSQRGLTVTQAGLTLAVGGLTWAMGSFTQSRPGMAGHRIPLMRLGMALVTLAIGYAPLVLSESIPVWTIAVAWALGCYGMGVVITSTGVLLLEQSPPEETGRNSSALQLSDGLSNVLLLALCGLLFASLGGGQVSLADAAHSTASGTTLAFVAVYTPSAVVALIGVLVMGRLRPARPE
ncbi:MFS transporter [Streptomyces sp. NPDC005438]|uniref:MFS transporter n=1 Tax=Streptomyces sp. NPDC005438 TaxID=3156880 RepID=UPI0033B9F25E